MERYLEKRSISKQMSTSVSIYLVSFAPDRFSTRLSHQRGEPNQGYSPRYLSWSLPLHLERVDIVRRDLSSRSSDGIHRHVTKLNIELDQNWWRYKVPDSLTQLQSTNTTDSWSSICAYPVQSHAQERSTECAYVIDVSAGQQNLTSSRSVFSWHSKHSIWILQYSQ